MAAAAAALVSACATVQPPAPPGDSLSGRLAVKVDASAGQPARSVTAGFELAGSPPAGRMSLTSPLGTMVAQADWSPEGARLVTSDGESRFGNLDELTREMLGESLPVAALFDWLRAGPGHHAAHRTRLRPARLGRAPGPLR